MGSKDEMVVFGTGGHAKVVVDAIRKGGRYDIRSICAPWSSDVGDFLGYRVVQHCECHRGIVAIGDNWQRSKLVEDALARYPDFEFISIIHPTAVIANDVTIGAGAVILAGAVVQSHARIGCHAILNTGAIVEHDCFVGDYSSLAPRAVMGGGARLGNYSSISIGATISHRVIVGQHCLIGAGAVLLKSLPDNLVSYGVPARPIRRREPGEPYL